MLVLPVEYPDEFATGTKDGARVIQLVRQEWPTAPKDLRNIADDDSRTLLVSCKPRTRKEREKQEEVCPGGVSHSLAAAVSEEERTALREDGEPRYLFMRFARVIPQAVLDALLEDWDHLVSLGVIFPEADDRRSGTPALHLGVWGLFGSVPRITGDSQQKALKEPHRSLVIAAMDRMCMRVKIYIVPKLERLMAEFVPEQSRVQEMCVETVFHCSFLANLY